MDESYSLNSNSANSTQRKRNTLQQSRANGLPEAARTQTHTMTQDLSYTFVDSKNGLNCNKSKIMYTMLHTHIQHPVPASRNGASCKLLTTTVQQTQCSKRSTASSVTHNILNTMLQRSQPSLVESDSSLTGLEL